MYSFLYDFYSDSSMLSGIEYINLLLKGIFKISISNCLLLRQKYGYFPMLILYPAILLNPLIL